MQSCRFVFRPVDDRTHCMMACPILFILMNRPRGQVSVLRLAVHRIFVQSTHTCRALIIPLGGSKDQLINGLSACIRQYPGDLSVSIMQLHQPRSRNFLGISLIDRVVADQLGYMVAGPCGFPVGVQPKDEAHIFMSLCVESQVLEGGVCKSV